jgi:radical SAM superfamily enzyme YgiQ (UPF0313 family)
LFGLELGFLELIFNPNKKLTFTKGTQMKKKKGLLISPLFPADAFWSAHYVKDWLSSNNEKRKALFTPLGLLTFAASMPQEEWEFELLDLNVAIPSYLIMHRMIQKADAVFVGAMNIQRESLCDLLTGPAKGTNTPWVLGGPMASTYRNSIIHPETPEDHMLHDGLDHVVWGEAGPRISGLCASLEENPVHNAGTPKLYIPERVLVEPDGARKYLRDEEIFKPLGNNVPTPLWGLIDQEDYRASMIQTTAGCRFRCSFCDIVEFNGGFARAKDMAAVTRELQAIYDTGFRGGVFTVDDNFVSDPEKMRHILEAMINFQRSYNYPFNFLTQASVDLGSKKIKHLIPLMKQAGFVAVFLGIENPDRDALLAMNKVQNTKIDPADTIALLQEHGIEVYAGFIFGADTDTPETANLIVDFVIKNSIHSSMTGGLTPMPHTPLYVELDEQDRLTGQGTPGNNITDKLGFLPKMGVEAFSEGFSHILSTLFSKKELHKRAEGVLRKVGPHIFVGDQVRTGEKRAAAISIWKQGKIWRVIPDLSYVRLLVKSFLMDLRLRRTAKKEINSLVRFWNELNISGDISELEESTKARFTEMLELAHEAFVRFNVSQKLEDITLQVESIRASLSKGTLSADHAKQIYAGATDYLHAYRKLGKFPGCNLVQFFRLIITGYHYMKVAKNVLTGTEKPFNIA